MKNKNINSEHYYSFSICLYDIVTLFNILIQKGKRVV